MGNIAKIASCKCNKQQDQEELDLKKDKIELLKNIENSKREDINNLNDVEYHNQNFNIDNINNCEIVPQLKHNKHPIDIFSDSNNFLYMKEYKIYDFQFYFYYNEF